MIFHYIFENLVLDFLNTYMIIPPNTYTHEM